MDLSAVMNSTSGLDALVEQYMYLQKEPLTRLQQQKSTLTIRSAMYEDIRNKISALETLAEDLAETDEESIYRSALATSSNTDYITVSAETGAAEGTYVFRIRQLATATTMRSTSDLNTSPSIVSSAQVAAGTDELDIDEEWEDAGFDTTPTGSLFIDTGSGEIEFVLSNYSSVDAFMDAINESSSVEAKIYYDDTRDKFFIEKVGTGGYLRLRQSTANGFLTQAKIATDTLQHEYTTNVSGLQTDQFLYETNFDNAPGESDNGSFKINGVTIEWDADQDTLNDIISDINNSTAGVTAFYDDTLDRVVMTSTTMGSDEIQWEDVTGSFLGSTLAFTGVMQSTGQDAKFTINSTNSDDEITKNSNTFTINSVTYTLKAISVENDDYADADTEAITINARRDISAIKNKINSFLSNFNSLTKYIKTKSAVDSTTYTRGALAGDVTYTSLRSQLFNIMMGRVDGIESGKPQFLSEIGITFNSSLEASLSDTNALEDWIDEDYEAVENLFNSTDGIATRIEALLEAYVETDGIIDGQKETVEDQIDGIEDRIESMEKTLEKREEYYRQELARMQMVLNELVQQQSYVSSLLSWSNNMLS